MSGPAIRWFVAGATALATAIFLTGCAVGPDFVHPAAPEIIRYTREPLAAPTSSANRASGGRQAFLQGRDIPEKWWALFKSPALNTLIEQSLRNNPNLQSALATLRSTRETVLAQQGKFFPLVQANFNPTYQRTSAAIAPVPASNASVFTLDTVQLTVAYTFDIWGLNRRTVELLEALADVQRFQVEAAYLSLTANLVVAAVTEASMRGQIDAIVQIIAINSKMRDTLRRQLEAGYANRSDLAAQEAALAQAEATLPPLRKALAQEEDLIAALAGAYSSQRPAPVFTLGELRLPADLPVSLPSQLIEQRPDVRAAEEQLHSASAQIGIATANMLPSFTISADAGFMNTALAHLLAPQNSVLGPRRQCRADRLRCRHAISSAPGSQRHLSGGGLDLSRHGDRGSAECRRRTARAAKRRRGRASGSSVRTRRTDELRSRGPANANRQCQCAAAAQRAAKLSPGGH